MDGETLAGAGIPFETRSDRFDAVTIAIHWITLALVAVIFIAAWLLASAGGERTAGALLLAHRSAGVLVWTLTLARLAWRHTRGRAVTLPATVSPVQRAAARANEYGLYLLLVLQPITGFLQSALRGRPFALLGFTVPAMMARDRGLTQAFHAVHALGAWALLALIGLHAGAALFHHFVLRDGVLGAMLPVVRRPGRGRL